MKPFLTKALRLFVIWGGAGLCLLLVLAKWPGTILLAVPTIRVASPYCTRWKAASDFNWLSRYDERERRIAAEALDLLVRHHWPGNVRELANTIERAVVLCAGETIAPSDLALPGTPPPACIIDPLPAEAADGFHAQIHAYRRQVLVGALRRTNGNHTQAAKLLGLHRTYFLRLLQRLNVRADEDNGARTPPRDSEASAPAPSTAR